MKYNDLVVEKNTRPTRKGRGIAAGQGKTAGRGTKGQKARTGHRKMPAGFMGGQRAIMQAVPKLKGFKSFHPKAEVVYTDRLNELSGKVDNFALAEAALISSPFVKVKVITRGELTAKIEKLSSLRRLLLRRSRRLAGASKRLQFCNAPPKRTKLRAPLW